MADAKSCGFAIEQDQSPLAASNCYPHSHEEPERAPCIKHDFHCATTPAEGDVR
jgi:hypothetical protein